MSPPAMASIAEPSMSSGSRNVDELVDSLSSSGITKYIDLSHIFESYDDQSAGQNQKHIATVMKELQRQLSECKTRLDQLGKPRRSKKEQQAYLIDISQRFTAHLRDAMREDYTGPFLTGSDVRVKNLTIRSAIQNEMTRFAELMNDDGCIQDTFTNIPEFRVDENGITRATYVAKVQQILKDFYDIEHPEILNPTVVSCAYEKDAFADFYWQEDFSSCMENLHQQPRSVALEILKHVAGEHATADRIMRFILNKAFSIGVGYDLEDMEKELRAPLLIFHDMTEQDNLARVVRALHSMYKERITQQRITAFLGEERIVSGIYKGEFEVEKLLECIVDQAKLMELPLSYKNEYHEASPATKLVRSYHRVARKWFVDDFLVNAEAIVMQKLPDIFTPTVVAGLSDAMLYASTEESQKVIEERQELQVKLTVLRKGEELLRQLYPETSYCAP